MPDRLCWRTKSKLSLLKPVAAGAAPCAIRSAAAGTVEALERRVLLSSYFVSTTGSDGGDGTLGSPFRTIQHAASLAGAGDTVYVRGGTYRETVTVPNSGTPSAPLTFRPYNNESVTVSGADPIGGWSRQTGAIYKASQPWDLGDGNNQVFVDGKMMIEARWPNASLDVSHPTRSSADRISVGRGSATLNDAALTQSYWSGATIHIAPGQEWVVQSGSVTSSAAGRLTYSYQPMSRDEVPQAGDPYYLTGKFQALDVPAEWYRDPTNSTLYLWSPDSASPASHSVEVKKRLYAFDLGDSSNVSIDGIKIFAAGISTGSASSNIILNHLDAQYIWHEMNHPTGWSQPPRSGIVLRGSNSAVLNSTIAFSSGDGVFIGGNADRVENCVIHDTDYAATDTAPVRTYSSNELIRNNTIYNAGRSGIKFSRSPGLRILNNTIHDVMLQTTDGGGVYTYGTNGGGSEIAYNRIYNVNAGGFGGTGLFLDNGSSNYLVHHNIVYNTNNALKMNPSSRFNKIYNNTLGGSDWSVATSLSADMAASVFKNNIFVNTAKIGGNASQSNNIYQGTDAKFANAAAGDFQLQTGSPAINAGANLGGITAGFIGSAPDIGALDAGKPAFGTGANFKAPPPNAPPPPVQSPPPVKTPPVRKPPVTKPPVVHEPTPKPGTGGSTGAGEVPAGSVETPVTPGVNVTEVTIASLPEQVIGGEKKARGRALIKFTNSAGSVSRGPLTIAIYSSSDGAFNADLSTKLGEVTRRIRLKPNASKMLRIKLKFPPPEQTGDYFIFATVSGAGSGSANTGRTQTTIHVERPAINLTVPTAPGAQSFSFGKDSQTVLSLLNSGNVAGKGDVDIGLFISADGTLENSTLLETLSGQHVNLKPNQSEPLKLTFTTPESTPALAPGSYSLLIKLNAIGDLAGMNESDNTLLASIPFTIS